MAKKPKYGLTIYVKRTPKKRKGRISKRPNKGSRKKRYRGRGR